MAAIPNAPGVPPLLTGFDTSLSVVVPLSADSVSGLGNVVPQWGIFGSGGGMVIQADTVITLDYRQEWVIADYPLERGQFESYDKVATPFDVRVRFVAGQNSPNRAALLSSIAAIANDYNLYDVVTPEAVYTRCNVRHYDYRRTAQTGLGVLAVDVWLWQIRNSQDTAAGGTQAPSGAAQINGGAVQSIPATSGQSAAGAGFN